MIENIENCINTISLFERDENDRKIDCYILDKVKAINSKVYYPDVLLKDTKREVIYNPIQERTMSLRGVTFSDEVIYEDNDVCSWVETPVFFLTYNVGNYYHFLYDTLPYLISYFEILKREPELKILLNYSSAGKKEFFPFVLETFKILGLEDRLVLLDDRTIYEKVYVSDSYTHGHDSNLPPREEVYKFFNLIKDEALKNETGRAGPKKIYTSRRSWLHNKLENIGTNYTSKRVMKNESELVAKLQKKGYVEVFTENMTMVDKIKLFDGAESVVGMIGGGIANVLFSPKKTKLFAVISPGFLDINARFIFCLEKQELQLICDTQHIEKTEFKTFMRVSFGDGYGEIYDMEGDNLKVNYATQKIAGWEQGAEYETITLHKDECTKLDQGLNSPFVLDIEKAMRQIK
jgi:hypothetical protein